MKNDFLTIVDVQPNFQRACHFLLPQIVEKINSTDQKIVCFYVGKELEGDTRNDVIGYFMENGVDFNKLDTIRFIEKDFGFFRNWMDAGVPNNITIKAIKYLKENSLRGSDNFNDDDWNNILTKDDRKKFSMYDDPIFYPNFKDKIFPAKEVNGIELIGGALHECLAEVDLYLRSLNKVTHINTSLCYGGKKDKVLENEKKLKNNKQMIFK